jgi:rare lipoprotein A
VSRRHLVPLIAAAAAVVVLVGGAVATVNLRSDTKPTSAAATDARSPQERADRGERPSPSAEPSPAPSAEGTSEQLAAASPKATTKSPTPTKTKASTSAAVTSSDTCKVSYYNTGSTTANGERFNPQGLTAAHKTMKFNTMVRVTNLANGKSVDVRINDRGPFVAGRCLDLAEGAFVKIASTGSGVITAKYEVLK